MTLSEIKFNQVFDEERKLQYVNGEASVLHCHHYASIFIKLALDHAGIGGPQHMFDAMEEMAFLTLNRYYVIEDINSAAERKEVAEQYFSVCGLGQLTLNVQAQGGNATMKHSHIDEGWIKKWGQYKKPVNLIGQGYIAGASAAVHRLSVGSFRIQETQSIVKGASRSEFVVKRND